MASPVELHAWLVAQWTEHRALAEAATPGPWEHVDYADPYGQPLASDGARSTFMGCGSVITTFGGPVAAPNGDLYPRGGYSPAADMTHIAANDPAFVIAVCDAALARLWRHQPTERQYRLADPVTFRCFRCDRPWPCPEVLGDAAPFADRDDCPQELKR